MKHFHPSSELHVAAEQTCNNQQRYALWKRKKLLFDLSSRQELKHSDLTRFNSHAKNFDMLKREIIC